MEPLIRYHDLVDQLTDVEYESFICKLIREFGRHVMDSFIFRQFTPFPINAKFKSKIILKAIQKGTHVGWKCSVDRKTERKKIYNACVDALTPIHMMDQQSIDSDTFTINHCIVIIQQIISDREPKTSTIDINHNIDSLSKDCAGKIASFLDCTSYHNLQCVNRKLFLSINSPITLQSLCVLSKEQANSYKTWKYPHIKEIAFKLELFNPLVSKLIESNVVHNKKSNISCTPRKLILFSHLREEPIDGIHYFPASEHSMFDLKELQTLSLNGAMRYQDYFDKLLTKINAMSSDKLQYLYTQNIRIDKGLNRNTTYTRKRNKQKVPLFPSLKGLSINKCRKVFSKFIPVFSKQLEALCIADEQSIPSESEFDLSDVQFPMLKELALLLSSENKIQVEHILTAAPHLKRIFITCRRIDVVDFNMIWTVLSSRQSLQCIQLKIYVTETKLDGVMYAIEKGLVNGTFECVKTLSICFQTKNERGCPTKNTLDVLMKVIDAIPSSIKDYKIALVVHKGSGGGTWSHYTDWIIKHLQVSKNVNCDVSVQNFHHKVMITNNGNKMKGLEEIWLMDIFQTNDKRMLPKWWH
eukprot:111670_1